MQQLGLDSKSSPKEESRIKELVWPELSSKPNIDSASDLAKWAAFILAGLLAVVGVLQVSPLFLFFAVVYSAIGWGFSRKNRVVAVIGFALIILGLISRIIMALVEIVTASASDLSFGVFSLVLSVSSLIIPAVVAVLFLNGMRAAFAHHGSAAPAADPQLPDEA